ncbi:MAG: hypothetical protein H6705_00885 [Myxococcales bacterium]|nr:hypothetical protein [Myxococcales bacterium]
MLLFEELDLGDLEREHDRALLTLAGVVARGAVEQAEREVVGVGAALGEAAVAVAGAVSAQTAASASASSWSRLGR